MNQNHQKTNTFYSLFLYPSRRILLNHYSTICQIKIIKQDYIQNQEMGPSIQSQKIKVDHPNGYFLSLTANPEKDTMFAQVNVPNMATLLQWQSSQQRIKGQGASNMLLPRHSKISQKPLCGQNFKLQVEYPCYHILLSKQIEKRQDVQKYLQEAQMWYLLFCLVQSAHSCHQLQRPIGEVRPQNLLLNKEGNLKILSNLSVPSNNDIYQPSSSKSRGLLSPEQLQYLKKSYTKPNDNYILSQSFSIGMTVLSAGVLQDLTKCYHYLIHQINMLEFNKIATFWHQNQFYSENKEKKVQYSKALKNIVMNLVEISPQRRMTSLEVFDLLSDFREDIMKLRPFQLKVDRWSPRKKTFKPQLSNQGIHLLRSKKQSQKSSPKKTQKKQIEPFNPHYQLQSPLPSQSLNNSIMNKTLSPTRKKKINTSLSLSNNKSTQHK